MKIDSCRYCEKVIEESDLETHFIEVHFKWDFE